MAKDDEEMAKKDRALQVACHPPVVDGDLQGQADLLGQLGYGRRESRVAADEMEERLQQRGIPLPPAVAVQQVVLDDPPDHGLVEEIRQLRPIDVLSLVHDRIAASFGEVPECVGAEVLVPPAMLAKVRPERLVDDRAQTVGRQKRLRGLQSVKGTDLGQ